MSFAQVSKEPPNITKYIEQLATDDLTKHQTLRRRVFLLFHRPSDSYLGLAILSCTIVVIFASVVSLCLSTLPSLRKKSIWDSMELAFITYFSIEFLLRLWSSPSISQMFQQFLTVVDLVVIGPFWIEFFLKLSGGIKCQKDSEDGCQSSYGGLTVGLRMLRLLRVFRIIRVGRYSSGLQNVILALKMSLPILWIIFVYMIMLVCFFGYFIFLAERGNWNSEIQKWEIVVDSVTQPSSFQNAFDGIWFVVTSMTTVGYGDKFPLTGLGKALTSALIVVGVLGIAFPTSAVGAAYIQIHATTEQDETQEEVKTEVVGHRPELWELCKEYTEMRTIALEVSDLISQYDPIVRVFDDGQQSK
eukprot:c3632_g1_i2.p1 GENE.c3632_g1_i2~~c3632_g1_i2.p1  ORF type:complete len:359 (+),score=67.60 c3632_g1_i2:166-1242(+)